MNLAKEYLEKCIGLLKEIEETQMENIQKAADAIAECTMNGGIIHTFGSGHSLFVAQEPFHRAGGLQTVSSMPWSYFDSVATKVGERTPGLGKAVVHWNDVRKGDVVICVSNSGVNALPVDVAIEAKKLGATVIAITSLKGSKDASARGSGRSESGKKLYEVADIVLDNCGVPGDAILNVGLPYRIIATSTGMGICIIQAVVGQAIGIMLEKGFNPPINISHNIDVSKEIREGNLERLKKWGDRYPIQYLIYHFAKADPAAIK